MTLAIRQVGILFCLSLDIVWLNSYEALALHPVRYGLGSTPSASRNPFRLELDHVYADLDRDFFVDANTYLAFLH
jgi:hypothetical protein